MRPDLRAQLALALGLLLAAMLGALPVAALALAASLGLLLLGRVALRPLGLASVGLAPLVLLDGALVGSMPFASLGPVALHAEGLLAGLALALRALVAVALAAWLARTASSRDALRLLHRWPRFAVLVAGTLRFAPLAAHDAARVRESMELRGMAPGRGLRGARSAAAMLVPLFVLTVRRGQVVDEALRGSAFGSGRRTPPGRVPWRRAHLAVALAGLALAALAVLRAVRP